MIEMKIVGSLQKKENLRDEYIRTLMVPIDSFWQNVVIGSSTCYEIIYYGKMVGHFFVDSHKTLVQFYVHKEYFRYASEVFKHVITCELIEKAAVSTKEPDFLALCLDYQKSLAVDTYLFTDKETTNYAIQGFNDICFRVARKSDIKEIRSKCDFAYEGYYEDLVEKNQLFVLYNGKDLLAIGELRISSTHEQYADMGMHVVKDYRNHGVGTYIVNELKEHCYKNKLIPMAGCDVKNIISKNTLEKCGLICNHRIIYVNFDN